MRMPVGTQLGVSIGLHTGAAAKASLTLWTPTVPILRVDALRLAQGLGVGLVMLHVVDLDEEVLVVRVGALGGDLGTPSPFVSTWAQS